MTILELIYQAIILLIYHMVFTQVTILTCLKPRTERFRKYFIYSTIHLWNNLSDKGPTFLNLSII